jgi:hypothetical protein
MYVKYLAHVRLVDAHLDGQVPSEHAAFETLDMASDVGL